MNPLLIATAVAYQCVVTPFNADGVPMLCKTCTKNGVTASVICVRIKEKTDEKTNSSGFSPISSDCLGGMHNVNLHNTQRKDGGMYDMLRL